MLPLLVRNFSCVVAGPLRNAFQSLPSVSPVSIRFELMLPMLVEASICSDEATGTRAVMAPLLVRS